MNVNDTIRIVIGYTRVMLQAVASLTDGSRGIIYDHNMFIVQATGPQGHSGHRAIGLPWLARVWYGHSETLGKIEHCFQKKADTLSHSKVLTFQSKYCGVEIKYLKKFGLKISNFQNILYNESDRGFSLNVSDGQSLKSLIK
jgi:hypothetical protein